MFKEEEKENKEMENKRLGEENKKSKLEQIIQEKDKTIAFQLETIRQLEETLREVELQMRDQEAIIYLREAEIERLKKLVIPESQGIPDAKVEQKPTHSTNKRIDFQVFYSVPPKNKLFFGRSLTEEFFPMRSIFKIMIPKGNATQAYYEMVDDSKTIEYALNMPDAYIIPAAELVGKGNLNQATRIWTSRKGELVLVNKNWKIQRKMVINYE